MGSKSGGGGCVEASFTKVGCSSFIITGFLSNGLLGHLQPEGLRIRLKDEAAKKRPGLMPSQTGWLTSQME